MLCFYVKGELKNFSLLKNKWDVTDPAQSLTQIESFYDTLNRQ